MSDGDGVWDIWGERIRKDLEVPIKTMNDTDLKKTLQHLIRKHPKGISTPLITIMAGILAEAGRLNGMAPWQTLRIYTMDELLSNVVDKRPATMASTSPMESSMRQAGRATFVARVSPERCYLNKPVLAQLQRK